MHPKTIGIMGAMPEEINGVAALLANKAEISFAGRKYFSGVINDVNAVVVVSGWGKVAAAATVSTLIHKFGIDELIFTGVAGAIHKDLNIGDIVIGRRLVQHDMDARPFIPQYEIPLLQKTFFECGQEQLETAKCAVTALFSNHVLNQDEMEAFSIVSPRLWAGDIASGDQFISDRAKKKELLENLPGILCVEMEGAAVAQVCYENNIPFTIIRTISDAANEQSHNDFASFVSNVAEKYSVGVIKNILKLQ